MKLVKTRFGSFKRNVLKAEVKALKKLRVG